MKKGAVNLKEREEWSMGGFGGKEGSEEMQ